MKSGRIISNFQVFRHGLFFGLQQLRSASWSTDCDEINLLMSSILHGGTNGLIPIASLAEDGFYSDTVQSALFNYMAAVIVPKR